MDEETFLLFNEKSKENSDFDDLFETRDSLGYLVKNLCKYCGPLQIYPIFDQKVEAAAKVAQEFADPEMFNITLADGSKLGDNAEFIKAFAKIADFRQSVTSEDTVAEMSQSNVMTPATAQAEIDAIMNDKSHAYWDRKNVVGRQQAIQRMQELWGMVDG